MLIIIFFTWTSSKVTGKEKHLSSSYTKQLNFQKNTFYTLMISFCVTEPLGMKYE